MKSPATPAAFATHAPSWQPVMAQAGAQLSNTRHRKCLPALVKKPQ